MEANIENHAEVWELVTFLANFEKFVILVELVSGEEGLENDAAFGIAAESWAQVCTGDIIYSFNYSRTGAQG